MPTMFRRDSPGWFCGNACKRKYVRRTGYQNPIVRMTGEVRRTVAATRALIKRIRPCLGCGRDFLARGTARTCSRPACVAAKGERSWKASYLKKRPPSRKCPCCDSTFTPPYGDKRVCCSDECKATLARITKRAGRARRKAAERRASAIERVKPSAVLARDGWKCYLCGDALLKSGDHNHPKYGTIDHVVPLSRGGTHTYANLRACCRACNNAKGRRMPDEVAHG